MAHPKVCLVEQSDDESQCRLPGKGRPSEIPIQPFSYDRQSLRKGRHPVELGDTANLVPPGMIDVLLPAPRISPRDLNVALRIGADPNILPGRGITSLLNLKL